MAFVRNLESFFEKYIEGFFNKKFSSGIQPVEIAKSLVKEMNSQHSVGVLHIYVPNSYSVYLSAEDYERIVPYGQAIREEVVQFLEKEAAKRNYVLVGKPIIDVHMDDSLITGNFRVASRYTEPLPNEMAGNMDAADTGRVNELSSTRVFDKLNVDFTPSVKILGELKVLEGLDAGMAVKIRTGRVNIGRRENNEMPLSDMNTSRLHAYITHEDGKHVLHDAKSLNGTHVNGHRITRKILRSGDCIKLGNTVILYEVK